MSLRRPLRLAALMLAMCLLSAYAAPADAARATRRTRTTRGPRSAAGFRHDGYVAAVGQGRANAPGRRLCGAPMP